MSCKGWGVKNLEIVTDFVYALSLQEELATLEMEFNNIDHRYYENDSDGKLAFQEFLEIMKENHIMKKMILKVADSGQENHFTASRPVCIGIAK
jgi:hypothetical protein